MTITTVSCIPISKHQPLVKEKKRLCIQPSCYRTSEGPYIQANFCLFWKNIFYQLRFGVQWFFSPNFVDSRQSSKVPQPIDFRKVVRFSLGSPGASEFTARQMCGSNFFPVVIMQTAFWKSTRSIKPYASEVKRKICLECTGGMHTPSKWAEMVILFCSKFCISCSEYAFSEERNREWFSWN